MLDLGREVTCTVHKTDGGIVYMALLDRKENMIYFYTNRYRDEFALDNKKIVELEHTEDDFEYDDDYDSYIEDAMYSGMKEVALGIF